MELSLFGAEGRIVSIKVLTKIKAQMQDCVCVRVIVCVRVCIRACTRQFINLLRIYVKLRCALAHLHRFKNQND